MIFLVFSYFFARILANLTGAIQHTGLGSDIPDWRAVCHTVKVNPLVRYLYWNMNYHTEHHMYAAVPFFNLAKLRAAIEKDVPGGARELHRLPGEAVRDQGHRRRRTRPSSICTRSRQAPRRSECNSRRRKGASGFAS